MKDAITDCRDAGPELSALLDGELEPAREGAWRAHLDSCSRCRHRLRWLETTRAGFAELEADSPSESFDGRLEERLLDPARQSRRHRPGRRLAAPRFAAAMAAALATAVGIALLAPEEREPVSELASSPAVSRAESASSAVERLPPRARPELPSWFLCQLDPSGNECDALRACRSPIECDAPRPEPLASH